MPTLILRGAHDLSTPAISKTLTDGIPHAREVVFADSCARAGPRGDGALPAAPCASSSTPSKRASDRASSGGSADRADGRRAHQGE